MKRRFSVIFMLLVIMAMLTSTVFAAPAAKDSKYVTLYSVQYREGGMILLFHTSGLTKDDLKNNSFYAHSNTYNMSCNFIDDSTDVRCVLPKKLAQFEGEEFQVILAGFGFYDTFPINTYCSEGEKPWVNYSVYIDGELVWDNGEAMLQEWNYVLTSGLFDYWAQYGITYEITGQFCSSDSYDFLSGPT
jgi:hypothetical protein